MNFIERLAPFAVQLGQASGVLPSLIIAQGVLESASGTSDLAVKANNLFGIKEGSGWTGAVYAKSTTEYRANGTPYQVKANFRKYPSYEGAVKDLCYKYTHGTGWESHNRYAAVLNQTDYKKAAHAVFAAGYATDPKYPEKLIAIIEQYNLAKYDKVKENANMVKVALDAGHGINTPGKRTPDGEREWSFNSKVIAAAIKYLKDYPNVEVLRLDDPTGKTDVPLATRTNKANKWKADILISMHHNANTGKWGSWTGTETYTYTGSWKNAERLAAIVQKKMVAVYGLRDRGLKKANFHMTRESAMPAILIEGGYMDSTIDIVKLRDDKILDAAGKAIAESVAEYFGLKKKPGATAAEPPEKEVDEMAQPLPNTQKADMKGLLAKAYKEKVFSEDHTSKVDTMTRGQALDLLISYVARTK
ncbi:N-acetylmuramoyl-L-alanine amidase [Sporosarcina contaminans]|uniref:N-acetylmuramoyl-L-alanine amidase n=1 Tax=Sporosarcina contaminans TaxID=633403 RepID=A0ABW3TTB5_9BACL